MDRTQLIEFIKAHGVAASLDMIREAYGELADPTREDEGIHLDAYCVLRGLDAALEDLKEG